MNKIISFLLLAAGIMLLLYVATASDSLSSAATHLLRGSPSEKITWFFVCGIVATVSGLYGMIRGSKTL